MTEPQKLKLTLNPATDPLVRITEGASPLIVIAAFVAGIAIVIIAVTLLARMPDVESEDTDAG